MLKTCKLTKIDAKIGVLMIHQNTSVFSIMSQHLGTHEKILIYMYDDDVTNQCQHELSQYLPDTFSYPTSL